MVQVELFIGYDEVGISSRINAFLEKIKDCEIIDIMQNINDHRVLITVVYWQDKE